MTRKNESASATRASRRDWTAPRVRRLRTSGAEFGVAGTIDAEGLS